MHMAMLILCNHVLRHLQCLVLKMNELIVSYQRFKILLWNLSKFYVGLSVHKFKSCFNYGKVLSHADMCLIS